MGAVWLRDTGERHGRTPALLFGPFEFRDPRGERLRPGRFGDHALRQVFVPLGFPLELRPRLGQGPLGSGERRACRLELLAHAIALLGECRELCLEACVPEPVGVITVGLHPTQ